MGSGRGSHFRMQDLVLGAAVLNVALWFTAEHWRHDAIPAWVRRLLISCAFAFGTWAGVWAAFDEGRMFDQMDIDPVTLLGLAVVMIVVALYALRRREDVYPLAVVIGTFIIVGMAWLARVIEFADEAGFFILAIWLIITSTLGSRYLLSLMRDWRAGSRA